MHENAVVTSSQVVLPFPPKTKGGREALKQSAGGGGGAHLQGIVKERLQALQQQEPWPSKATKATSCWGEFQIRQWELCISEILDSGLTLEAPQPAFAALLARPPQGQRHHRRTGLASESWISIESLVKLGWCPFAGGIHWEVTLAEDLLKLDYCSRSYQCRHLLPQLAEGIRTPRPRYSCPTLNLCLRAVPVPARRDPRGPWATRRVSCSGVPLAATSRARHPLAAKVFRLHGVVTGFASTRWQHASAVSLRLAGTGTIL